MSSGIFLRLLACIAVVGASLFIYIDFLNTVTELRLAIPDLAKEVKDIQEENQRLRYDIDNFENPLHLMELARKPEFSHLKHPSTNEILIISEKSQGKENGIQ